jgi:uncharacterized membrane protein HdeD (DUF308 family)
MKSILRERRLSSTFSALIAIALGVVLLLWPDLSSRLLCMILGATLLIAGAGYIISYFARRSRLATLQFEIILGIVLAILGLWLLLRPDIFLSLLQFVFGAVLVIHGVIDLQAAFHLQGAGYERWWLALILALLTVVLGAVIILDPFTTLNALLMLIGVALIYDGISDLLLIFRLSRVFRAVAEVVEEATAVPTDCTVADDDGSQPPQP